MSERVCRFLAGGQVSYGRLRADRVVVLDGAPWDGGHETSKTHPLSEVKLLAPVVPGTFYAVGFNYRDHIIAAARRTGGEPRFPTRPDVGLRSSSALCATEDPIIKPADSGELFQYEAELVAVIGKKGRSIPKDRALQYVFGWTIGNDVTEREWQRSDRTNWRAKNTDTFKPMGPWISSGLDYRKMTTVVRLNGIEVERFPTGDMVNDVETYVSEVSKYCTLYPGDVIWMGTDGSPRSMKPGDVCEIEISGIGMIRNTVVLEGGAGTQGTDPDRSQMIETQGS